MSLWPVLLGVVGLALAGPREGRHRVAWPEPEVEEPELTASVVAVPAGEAEEQGLLAEPELWVSDKMLRIRREPRAGATWRGLMNPGSAFEVLERADGSDCPEHGWGRVGPGAWTCLDSAEPAPEGTVAQVLPQLVAFDAPEPAEWETYLETGSYDRAPSEEAEALVPFVYGKRWRGWKARVWESPEALLAGETPSSQLGRVGKYAFVDVLETEQGTLLVREDGSVARADDVHVYPIDRFGGRDLVERPLPEGRGLGWVFHYEGATLWSGVDSEATVLGELVYHQELETGREEAGRVEVFTPEGTGWVDRDRVRLVQVQARPGDVSPETFWLDTDLEEQVLVALVGDTPVYATLVSTGKGRRNATPTGLYRVMDKAGWWDMASLPGASDPYHVEKVPWTMHFYPRYALHGVFWHWGFGHTASHGCINLAPRDARWVFEHVSPAVQPGWLLAYESPEEPGTVLRVRKGDQLEVRDRRRSLD